MNSVRQVQIDEKVFELSTVVTFRCDTYLDEKKQGTTLRNIEKEN